MIGTVISHYKILEKLGEGGMGIVYKAHDTSLDRTVALKFLPHYLTSDATEKERFYHEARAASALNHPNITTIYEIAEFNGQLYISMELVEGQTLKHLIQDEPPSLKKVLDIVIQVCDGLSAAEEKKIVHRDIKSDNIMITPKGQVKIMDFGLAKVKGSTKITKAGSTVGTAAYMSPEQAQGEEVDHRSDIFSFGVVLYELLTTKLPFRGEHQAALMYSLINEDPLPLARFNDKVSPDLERIVLKVLAKDRDERYQHVDDLLADLRRERKGLEYARAGYVRGISSASQSAVPPSRKNSIRRIVIVSGILVVLAGLFVIFNPFNVQISTQNVTAAEKNSIAVLYFQNIVDPEDKGHTGDMLADLLITSLSQGRTIDVISRERLFDIQKELKADSKSITPEMATRVAQRAGVSTMLMGSILQEEPELAVTTRLVNVQSGQIISSQRVTGFSGKQIFNLVDSLSALVRKDLAVASAPATEVKSVAEVTTKSPEAYRSYIEAVDLNKKFFASESHAAFRKAIELDSNFAMAYFGLAVAFGGGDDERKEAIQHAWRLRNNVTELERLVIESVYTERVERNNPKAREIMESIIEKYPRASGVYQGLSNSYNNVGEYDKSLKVVQKGLLADSLDKIMWNQSAYMHALLGRKNEALASIDRYLALAPAEPNPYDSKGDILMMYGEPDSAISWWRKALSFRSDFSSTGKLAFQYLLKNDTSSMEKYGREYAAANGAFQEIYTEMIHQLIRIIRGKLHEAQKIAVRELSHLQEPQSRSVVPILYNVLAWDAYELGDLPRMVDNAQKCSVELRKNPANRIYGRDGLAIAYAVIGDTAKARKTIEELRQSFEAETNVFVQAQFFYAKAIVSFQSHDYSGAIEEFERFNGRLFPHHAPNYFYALSLLKANKVSAAIDEFERLTSVSPISFTPYDLDYLPTYYYWPIAAVKAHYWLGTAYEQQGSKEKAVKEYNEFLDTWKDADFDSKELMDAKSRLGKLKGSS